MVVRLWLVFLMVELLLTANSMDMMDDEDDLQMEDQLADQLADRLPQGAIPRKTPESLVLMQGDMTYTGTITKTKKEIYILIPQDTDKSLTITVSPCGSTLNWYLTFVKEPRTKLNGPKTGPLLAEYTGVSIPTTYFRPKAIPGLYFITAQAVNDDLQVKVDLSFGKKSPVEQIWPRCIKIKREGEKVALRWNLSPVDHHLMEYYLVISTSKIYSTLCEAEGRLADKQLNSSIENEDSPLNERLEIHYLKGNTHYTLNNLVNDKTYYFTVFAVNGSRMSPTQHANATYTFQRPRPLGLKDAKPEIVNLRALSGRASFRYKVGRKTMADGGDPSTLYWYVMSCNGVVDVEIRHKKVLLLKKRVFGYEKLILNNIKRGERYVLKVETVSVDETQRVRTIEVMATVRQKMFPMPDMPADLSLIKYGKRNDCQSVTIGWLPAKSDRSVSYCVYVQEYNNNVEFSTKPDQCTISNRSMVRRNNNSNIKKKCYFGGNKKPVIEKILKLKPSLTYTIQVTVTKLKGRTLSYDRLKVDTNTCGLN
ncbi:protein NDNF [Adelges cooleyi]|uniref:protein NDNF n=1 Tax=Adelges cooleyi TaxID=133065 RepID=UPI00217F7DF4|nr:protein NDNF [Adelges cooleyi]